MNASDLVLILVATAHDYALNKADVYRLAKMVDDALKLGIGIEPLPIVGSLYSIEIEDALNHNVALGLMIHKHCYDGSKRWDEYEITNDGLHLVSRKEYDKVIEIIDSPTIG